MTPDLTPLVGVDMVAVLTALAGLGQGALAAGLMVFARVAAAVAVLPAFGERVVPVRIRLVLALAMTAVVAPAIAPDLPPPPAGPLPLARFLMTETLAGLALGMAVRLMVMALMIAGTIAAQATSLAQFFGGATPDPQPAMAQILMLAGIAFLVLSGLPERAAEYLILSYALLPAGGWPDAQALAAWGTGRIARAFALGFTLAAPFVIGSALYNLALGAINRAMPTLMVAFVGAPAITLAGLALLAIAAPVILSVWGPLVLQVLANPGLP
jgi:flagellar biosynthetic protein FliR